MLSTMWILHLIHESLCLFLFILSRGVVPQKAKGHKCRRLCRRFRGKKKTFEKMKKGERMNKNSIKKKNQWGYSPRHLKSELEKKQTVFPSSPVQTFLIGCRGWRCLCLPAPPPKPNPIDLGMTPHTPTNTHTHRPPPTNSSEPSDCFRVGFVEALARRRPFCEVPATDWCVYVCVCVCVSFFVVQRHESGQARLIT